MRLFKKRFFVPYAEYERVLEQGEKDANLAAELVSECQRLSEEIDKLSEENDKLRLLYKNACDVGIQNVRDYQDAEDQIYALTEEIQKIITRYCGDK